MKILIDAHKFGEKHEGTSTYLSGIYQSLMLLHPEWEYVFVGRHQKAMQGVFGQGPHVRYRLLKAKNRFWRMMVEMPQILRQENPDYAHFQYITPMGARSPYIVTTHDILFEEKRFRHFFPFTYRWLNGFLFRRSARKAKILCTVSAYSKEKIVQYYGKSPGEIVVTPNAVKSNDPNNEFDQLVMERYGLDRFLLLVSRVEPRKNHLALYRSFVALGLKDKGYKLVLIGKNEWQSQETKDFVAQHQSALVDAMVIIEDIDLAHLEAFYRCAEVFVYPSFAEGFGIPPLEAAIAQTKVVCSSATAMKDFDFFPYHIDPTDQDALDTAINEAIHDEDYDLQGLKNVVRDKYQWTNSAQILAEAMKATPKQQ